MAGVARPVDGWSVLLRGPLHASLDSSQHRGLHDEVGHEEEGPERYGQVERTGPVAVADDQPGLAAFPRFEYERPAAVAELGPQPLLEHPFGLRPVVGEQQQPARFDGPDRLALLTDQLPDLGVLEVGDDLPGAGDAVVVGQVERVPSLVAPSRRSLGAAKTSAAPAPAAATARRGINEWRMMVAPSQMPSINHTVRSDGAVQPAGTPAVELDEADIDTARLPQSSLSQ